MDPEYALAYSGFADANIFAAFYSFLPGKEIMADVKQAAETAIKLDNSLSEAYGIGGKQRRIILNQLSLIQNMHKHILCMA